MFSVDRLLHGDIQPRLVIGREKKVGAGIVKTFVGYWCRDAVGPYNFCASQSQYLILLSIETQL